MVRPKSGFVGSSSALQELLEDVELVAPRDTTVLVTGESGTGKELLAQHIHRLSPRRDGPFVTCDCAALSPSLCEGELFGYRRGAFTGALRDTPGYLASSDGGTLFLDEIAELNAASQTRLLRFLEQRTVVPLGEVAPRPLDVRIVAATNRELDEMIETGQFRDDLYFRLNVINLRVRPLRERPDDLLPLAEYFRRHFALKHGKRVVGFTPQAEQALRAWHWPGNVRELRNAVERAIVLCRGTWIDRSDLPERILGNNGNASASVPPTPVTQSFAERTLDFQRRLLRQTLAAVNGDRREAARRLQLTAHQLKYLISKLELGKS